MPERRSNTRLAVALAAVCGVMVGASFAAVPFYSWFCQVTGYGGTTNLAGATAPEILDREVTVRFDANTAPDVAGQAGYNVVPYEIGRYFDKIACFCFDMQVLQPHERIDMPVSFYVDPAMVDDLEARGTSEITLSYTMFRTELPEASLVARPESRLAAVPAERAGTIEQ